MKRALVSKIPENYWAERFTKDYTPEGVTEWKMQLHSKWGTLGGATIVRQGDWVLTDNQGNKKVMTDSRFRREFEAADPEAKAELAQFEEK